MIDKTNAIETFKHWIEYEKANKNKIHKADELIEIQETILKELETYKKIAEKLAIETAKHGKGYCQYSEDYCLNHYLLCRNCVLEWARKEVEKDVKD